MIASIGIGVFSAAAELIGAVVVVLLGGGFLLACLSAAIGRQPPTTPAEIFGYQSLQSASQRLRKKAEAIRARGSQVSPEEAAKLCEENAGLLDLIKLSTAT